MASTLDGTERTVRPDGGSYTGVWKLDRERSSVRARSGRYAERDTSLTKILLLCGAIAGPVFVLAVLVQDSTRPGFNPRLQPLSLLSLGEWGWIQVVNFVLAGALNLLFAGGLWRTLLPGRAGTWGPLLIGAYGLGLVWVGLFRTDPAHGFPPGVVAPTHPSWHGALHAVGALFIFIALTAALVVFARLFLARKERWWAFYCLASAGLTLLFFFGGVSGSASMAPFLRLATLVGWIAASVIALKLVCAPDTMMSRWRIGSRFRRRPDLVTLVRHAWSRRMSGVGRDTGSRVHMADVNGPALSVDHLSKLFGDRVAFDDVSFEVGQGEVFGFLGPNDAGKTTAVRTLGTLIAPTSGSATVAGIPLAPENGVEIRRLISIMPESPGLYLRLTVAENLRYFADLYEVPDPKDRIDRALRAVRLADRAADACGSLSKGLRQRVALARALLSDPQVLFLDEPTSGLDPGAARDVHDLIEGLRRRGVTIFLTTHRLEEAERLCDRVAT
jgi:ABC-type Na+ transport system ATPase subunit NatA